MAAFAPIPSDSVRTTAIASPGVRINDWCATLRSRTNDMLLASLPRTSITLAKTKRHILHDLMCDKLVRAVRFRTPLWQIRTLERSLASGRIVRIQFADGRLNRPISLNRMSEVRSGVFLDSEWEYSPAVGLFTSGGGIAGPTE